MITKHLLAGLAAASVALGAVAASAQETTLRGVTAFAQGTTFSQPWEAFVERVNESGFEVRPKTGAATEIGTPTGPLADRVREVLNSQVNPAIAAHGGQINLVDVEHTDVYLQRSGGCQGCALSRMTLRQGVERMLRQAIPEISAVHDVTDHASGQNPYFNPEAQHACRDFTS